MGGDSPEQLECILEVGGRGGRSKTPKPTSLPLSFAETPPGDLEEFRILDHTVILLKSRLCSEMKLLKDISVSSGHGS